MGAETPRPAQQVEFELMTWPEVKQAFAQGRTTALFYTGGTEQRGPQDVNGGHNLMGKMVVKAIAQKLGNAIAMPVLPYTPNNASAELPGTIGLTPELLAAVPRARRRAGGHDRLQEYRADGRPWRRPAERLSRGGQDAERQIRGQRESTPITATTSM